MVATQPPVLPADLGMIAGISKDMLEQIDLVFSEILPRMMKEDITYSKVDMDEYITELNQLIQKNLSLNVSAISLKFAAEPTRFYWLLHHEILTATEKAKRELTTKNQYLLTDYDLEGEIKRTREQVERMLAERYKTEVKLWKCMDAKEFDDALALANAIEIERKDKDLHLRIEATNWKVMCAAQTGYVDMSLKGLVSIMTLAQGQIAYSPADVSYVVDLLLSHIMVGFGVQYNLAGLQASSINMFPGKFYQKQAKDYHEFLVRKITEGIFRDRVITDERSFKDFVRTNKDNHIQMFKLSNMYVGSVTYAFKK